MAATTAPALPDRPSQLPTTHAQFLLDQARSSIHHLHTSGALDVITYRDVEYKLSKAVLKQPDSAKQQVQAETTTRDVAEAADLDNPNDSEEVKLGKRNAFFRKALIETDMLPQLVSTALSTVAGGILGSSQIDAIQELVSMSQKRIVYTLTDPKVQRSTGDNAWAGLKGAHTGAMKGISSANSSISSMNKVRQENVLKKAQKREKKKEEKMLKQELKREREEVRKRVAGPSQSTGDSSITGDALSSPDDNDGDTDDDDDDDDDDTFAASGATQESTASSGSAVANVACLSLGKSSSAAITTFSPFPGVMISQTLVASPTSSSISLQIPDTTSKGKAAVLRGSSDGSMDLVNSPTSMSLLPSRSATGTTTAISSAPPQQQATRTLGAASTQSMSREEEARLRSRQPPPLPSPSQNTPSSTEASTSASQSPTNTRPTPSTAPTARASSQPEPPAPPPQHRHRPAIGERQLSETDRTEMRLDERGGADDGESESESEMQRQREKERINEGEVVDTTERKRKGWKTKLLG